MKKFLFIIFIFLSINVFSLNVYNLHINGINTTQSEAYQNILNLRRVGNITSNIVKWDLVYNPSSQNPNETNLLANISDTIKQKNAELSLDDYTKIYIKSFNLDEDVYKEGFPQYLELQKNLVSEYNKVLSYKGVNFDTIVANFNQSTDYIFDSVTSLLTANNKDKDNTFVLLIPHSQGNLYANSLYDYLIDKDLIKKENLLEFGIATPASSMRSSDIYKDLCILTKGYFESEGIINEYNYYKCGYSNYLTDTHDRVISDLVGFLYSGTSKTPLPANNSNKNNEIFSLNHDLVDYYLAPNENDENSSTYKIKSGIWQAMIYFQDLLKIKSYEKNSKYAVFNLQTDDNTRDQYQTTRLLDNSGKIVCDRHECFNTAGYFNNDFLNIGYKYETNYFIDKNFGDYKVLTDYTHYENNKPVYAGYSFIYIYQYSNNDLMNFIYFTRDNYCRFDESYSNNNVKGFNLGMHSVVTTGYIAEGFYSCYNYQFLFENKDFILEKFSIIQPQLLKSNNRNNDFSDFYKEELNIINERKKLY